MIGTEKEEKQKDEVLQKINDLLEKCDWGDGCDRLTIRVVFEGKFNLCPFQVNQKEPVKLYFNSNDIGTDSKDFINLTKPKKSDSVIA